MRAKTTAENTSRIYALLDKGVITQSEAAFLWLLYAIDHDDLPELTTSFESLRPFVRRELRDLVREIVENKYKWSVFLIGSQPPPTFDLDKGCRRSVCDYIFASNE